MEPCRKTLRVLRCYLRTETDPWALRSALVADLGIAERDLVLVDPESPRQPEAPLHLRHIAHDQGFRTEIVLHALASSLPGLETALDLAPRLSRLFKQDAVAFCDPNAPAAAPVTHGLLLKPDGMSYRVPLLRDGEELDIPTDIRQWEPWQ
ncbi:MAG: hypothetical protein WC943_10200 [Elusimicrobiota bacterium]|jgi:hypothetical protein